MNNISINEIVKNKSIYIFKDTGQPVTGCVFYYTEGTKNEMNLKDGVLHGEQKKWDTYDDRLWQTEEYYNGQKNGYFKCWGSNRKLFWEYKYSMGKVEYSRHYHENGKLSSELIEDYKGTQEREYWENGQLRSEKIYNKNGLIKSISHFSESGHPTGSVELKNGNGKLIVENVLAKGTRIKFSEIYKMGKLDGLSASWINGNLNFQENYKSGLKDGLCEYWVSGELRSSIYFKKGKENGLSQDWFNGKKTSEGYYTMGKKNGCWRKWYNNGIIEREECYVNDKLHGQYKEFSENGILLKEENYILGKKIGLQKYYSNDGTLLMENNLINGFGIISFHEGNNRIEEHYVNGYLQKELSYRKNGELAMEQNWKNGKKHGVTRIWIRDGVSQEILNESYREENYKNGELHGIRTALSQYGRIKYKEIWENGELVSREK